MGMEIRTFQTVVAAVLTVGVGCTKVSIGDAATLSRQLRAEFHRPATVTLDGQRRLIVTVEASSADADSSADSSAASEPTAQAYRVARFVGAHYQHAGMLKAVTVIVEPAAGDSVGEPSASTFTASEISPTAARPVAPGTKSD
jgi:hypothetical protein